LKENIKIYTNLFEALSNKFDLPSKLKNLLNEDKKTDLNKSLTNKCILENAQACKSKESRSNNKLNIDAT
jgi:hypothetical protein